MQADAMDTFELAPEGNVFLVTGELIGFSSQKTFAMGYVVADDANQAAMEQLAIQPNLRISGVVSLAELRRQAKFLEDARMGLAPALFCGRFKKSESLA